MEKSKELLEKFWKFVLILADGDYCWYWTGHKDRRKYGIIYGLFGKGFRKAHRFSYELFNGPIKKGMFVCHKCDFPSCVNPGHLFQGTHQDNMLDALMKNRTKSKLKIKDVVEIRRLSKNGIKPKKLAKAFDVSTSSIYAVVSKKRFQNITDRSYFKGVFNKNPNTLENWKNIMSCFLKAKASGAGRGQTHTDGRDLGMYPCL